MVSPADAGDTSLQFSYDDRTHREHAYDAGEDVQDVHVDLLEIGCYYDSGHYCGTLIVPAREAVSVLG